VRCFYHRGADAVGMCKSCGRGLCPVCAAEIANGLACRDRCEDEVRALNWIIDRNKTAYKKTSGAYLRVAAFYLIVALVFLTAGVFDWRGLAWILIPGGAIFIVSAFLHFSTARKFERE
jgi:hypothetical protein